MPSNKFVALPEDKKKLILNAAKKEFTMKKYEDASINKIIKDINMPRGTFYLYFENKQDLYFYIFKSFIDTFKTNFIKVLNHNNGDVFLSFPHFYEDIVNEANCDYQFIKNLFINMNSKQLDIAMPSFLSHEIDGSIIKHMNIDNYLIAEEEKEVLLSIVMPLFFHSVAHTLSYIEQKEQIKRNFMQQLHMIKRGLERK